jgi:lactate dehydrogenase-like 2-hydroxyacid dehydrogenase
MMSADTVAVIEALKSGKIGYLGLDVYGEEEEIFFEDRSGLIIPDDVFDVAFATGLAALAPGCITGWHGRGWLRLWSEERESFVRNLPPPPP